MRFYISDCHFFHSSLNDFMDCRGFTSEEEMHEVMISRWNEKVRDNDEVVILGDFSIGRAAETESILRRLKGRKCLIRGNHDKFLDDKRFDRSLFQWVKDYEELKDNKRKIILSHYPIFCYNGQFYKDPEGEPKTFMLYGHVHKTQDERLVNHFIQETRAYEFTVDGKTRQIPCQMINCFCMFSDYRPLTLDEWIEIDRKRREELNHNEI